MQGWKIKLEKLLPLAKNEIVANKDVDKDQRKNGKSF